MQFIRRYSVLLVTMLLMTACPCSCFRASPLKQPTMPAIIEENRGQAISSYRYYAAGQSLSALFDDAGLTLDMHGEAVRLVLDGASATRVREEDPRPGRVNYFVGQDPAKWMRDVHTFGGLRYRNVYTGIDMVFHGAPDRDRAIEQDFVVAAGADPRRIRMRFEGASKVDLDETGALQVTARSKTVKWKKPLVYQTYSSRRHTVDSKYTRHEDGSIGFALGRYDASKPVVIDPVIAFATYTGSAGNDGPGRIATDAQGNIYIAGSTNDPTFPVTPGAFTANTAGAYNFNATITKLNAAGTQALYTTHFGGTVSNFGASIALDAAGNVYVCGGTTSPDFPTTPGAYSTAGQQNDQMAAFVAKFNAAGNQLLYGTYLNGSQADLATSIAVDAQGNAYVAGVTNSNNFPATPDAFQPSFRASGTAPGYDGFITKLNPQGSRLLYSTFLGGSGTDIIWSLAVAPDGSAYVAGSTSSANFPVTPRAFKSTFSGGSGRTDFYYPAGDAFVAKLSPDGSALQMSTYLGGKQDDAGMSVAFDADGNAFVGGGTLSADFPTTPGAWIPAYRGAGGENDNPSGDGFVAKVSADGTSLLYSTFVGGSMDDRVWAIAAEPAGGAVWAAGHTISKDFPVTADAAQKVYAGQRAGEAVVLGDAFVVRLNAAGSAATYATYHGGSGNDLAFGLTVAKDGSVVASGITSSANLPVTAGALQTRGRGGDTQGSPVLDSFVVRLSEPPPAPQVSVASVVNEASGNAGAVSPGLRVVVTGQNLTLPGQTARVLFDSLPAVIESATSKQIVCTVPYGLDGSVSTQMVVDTGSIKSAPVTIPVAAVMPGVYAASIANEDGTPNDVDHPAAAGGLVTFLMTGEGQTDPPGMDGLVATADRLPVPVTPVVAAVGDGGVEVVSVQAVEGAAPGKMQVVIRLPGDLAAGDYALVVLMGDAQSQPGVRIFVTVQ